MSAEVGPRTLLFALRLMMRLEKCGRCHFSSLEMVAVMKTRRKQYSLAVTVTTRLIKEPNRSK